MPNSIPAQETDEQHRLKILEALERAQDEVRAARKYIPELEKSIQSKQAIIDAQKEKQTLADAAIESLQKEVAAARAVIASQMQQIAAGEKEIEYLKKQLDKTNRKLSRARKVEKYLLFGLGAMILTTILK